jgi:hypothetical protein
MDSSRIVLWGQSGAIGVWSFVPKISLTIPQTDVNLHGVFRPGEGLVNLHGGVSPAQDLFCSGHAHVKGRLVVVGGQYLPPAGTETPHEFNPLYSDPDLPTATTPAWRVLASTARGRWYPSATALATGQLLASSGSRFAYAFTFGGDAGSLQNDVSLLGMGNIVEWTDPTGTLIPATPTPTPRKDHTAIMNDHTSLGHYFKHMVVFGGQTGPDQIPPASTLKSSEVWAHYLNPDDSTTHWRQYTTVDGRPPRAAATPRSTPRPLETPSWSSTEAGIRLATGWEMSGSWN